MSAEYRPLLVEFERRTSDDPIADHYENKRREADAIRERIAAVRGNTTLSDWERRELLRRLEDRLEIAVYTGD